MNLDFRLLTVGAMQRYGLAEEDFPIFATLQEYESFDLPVVAAYLEGTLVGYATVILMKPDSFISNLEVNQWYCRKGIEEEILRYVLRLVLSHGADTLCVALAEEQRGMKALIKKFRESLINWGQ